MANPTTNYGFVLPTSTDLVTDLPADFDVALQGVDTQMFTNANAAIAKSIVDAKGDLIAGSAADTVQRLAVGANNTILVADSSTATGLKWAAPAATGFPAGTTYTPTITSTTGTPTTTSVTAKYSQSGKYVVLMVDVQVVNKGTAAGAIIVSLPITAAATAEDSIGSCFEKASSGQSGFVEFNPVNSLTTLGMRRYDFGSFWTDNFRVAGTLIYEVA